MTCGMCLHASDIGIYTPGDPIAIQHPGCPEHGWCDEFTPGGSRDGAGRETCAKCKAYEDEHNREAP